MIAMEINDRCTFLSYNCVCYLTLITVITLNFHKSLNSFEHM